MTRLITLAPFIGLLALGCSTSSTPGDAGSAGATDAGDARAGDADAKDASAFEAPTCQANEMHLWDYGFNDLGIVAFWLGQVTGPGGVASATVLTTLDSGPVSVGFTAGGSVTLTRGIYVAAGGSTGPALTFQLFDLRCVSEPAEFHIDQIHTHTVDGGVSGLVLDSLQARWTHVCTVNGQVHHANAGCINFTGAIRDGGASRAGDSGDVGGGESDLGDADGAATDGDGGG